MNNPTQEALDLMTKARIEADKEQREAAEIIRRQRGYDFHQQQLKRALNYQAQYANQRPWPGENFQARVDLALLPIERLPTGRRIWRAICKVVKP